MGNLIFVWVGSRDGSTSLHLLQIARLVILPGGSRAVTATADAGIVGFFSDGR